MNAGDEKGRLARKEMEEDDKTDIDAKPRICRMEDAASTGELESIVSTKGTEESITGE